MRIWAHVSLPSGPTRAPEGLVVAGERGVLCRVGHLDSGSDVRPRESPAHNTGQRPLQVRLRPRAPWAGSVQLLIPGMPLRSLLCDLVSEATVLQPREALAVPQAWQVHRLRKRCDVWRNLHTTEAASCWREHCVPVGVGRRRGRDAEGRGKASLRACRCFPGSRGRACLGF